MRQNVPTNSRNCRGITLLSHVIKLKLLKSILGGIMQKRVEHEFSEEQQMLRKGRSTTDGIFMSRL